MKLQKRVALLVVVMAFAAVLFAGCGTKAQVAAKVGDNAVTYQEFVTAYENMKNYNGYYFSYDLSTDEGIEDLQDYVMNTLIQHEALLYYAQQQGFTLTAEEKEQAAKEGAESYEQLYAYFVEQAEKSGSSDVKAYTNKYLSDYLSQIGYTVKSMKELYVKNAEEEILAQKATDAINAEADTSEEAIQALYQEELEAQKTIIDADPSQYYLYETYSQYGYSCIPLYRPEGCFYVKHILVETEEEAQDIFNQILMGQITFEAALELYNTDSGEPEEGYIIGEGASFVEPFLNAALALEEEGDMTEPVQTEYGYHIIKRLKSVESGVIPYEELKDTLDDYFTDLAVSAHYSEKISEIINNEELTVRYEDVYRSYGK